MKHIIFCLTLVGCGNPQSPEAPVGATLPAYNRDEWGRWVDIDRDCQDTRQEVLIRDSETPVIFSDPIKPCRVVSGKWLDPYTGQVFTSSSDLEIDHALALEEAHMAGGWQWTSEQKKAYYNDMSNLVAVSVSANRSKGSRPPMEWLPSNLSYRCNYLKGRVATLEKYHLEMTCSLYVKLVSEHCH